MPCSGRRIRVSGNALDPVLLGPHGLPIAHVSIPTQGRPIPVARRFEISGQLTPDMPPESTAIPSRTPPGDRIVNAFGRVKGRGGPQRSRNLWW